MELKWECSTAAVQQPQGTHGSRWEALRTTVAVDLLISSTRKKIIQYMVSFKRFHIYGGDLIGLWNNNLIIKFNNNNKGKKQKRELWTFRNLFKKWSPTICKEIIAQNRINVINVQKKILLKSLCWGEHSHLSSHLLSQLLYEARLSSIQFI